MAKTSSSICSIASHRASKTGPEAIRALRRPGIAEETARPLPSSNWLTEKLNRRIKLVVQYDGTDFCGWAEQPNVRTVHGTLKDSIFRVSGEDVELRGASRTDSGAHARGQVADFASSNPMPTSAWVKTLNRALPEDVRIESARFVRPDFHSRFFARGREYRYTLSTLEKVEPHRARFVWASGFGLDIPRMKAAAICLLGKHDFRAFAEELDGINNCVRELSKAEVTHRGDEVVVTLIGSAFLRGMVRRITGGLFEVGRGKRTVEEFAELLDEGRRDRLTWPVVLPAKGLTLWKVLYGRKLRDLREENEEE